MISIRRGPATPSTDAAGLLSEEEAARLLGVAPEKLRRLRYQRRGPPTVKIGGTHRIRRHAFEDWLRNCEA